MLVFKSLHSPLSFLQQFASSPTSASNRSLMKSTRLTLDPAPLPLLPPPPPPQKNHETRFSIIHKNLLNKQGSFLPTRSSSGSRTWSDLTWICFGCDATWPAYRAESCQIPRACWRSPAGPLKPRWDAWESSPSPPSTRW